MIRTARPDDLLAMQEVERAAGGLFRDLAMTAVADDEPLSLAELGVFQQGGRAWVTTADGDQPVAYILVEVLDGAAHIEQVSVHPDHARRGLGRALVDTVEVWATAHDLGALTLTTFAHVPWNAPYYERLGFVTLPDADLSGGLRRIRDHEAALGLDRWPRVVMRRPVTRPTVSR